MRCCKAIRISRPLARGITNRPAIRWGSMFEETHEKQSIPEPKKEETPNSEETSSSLSTTAFHIPVLSPQILSTISSVEAPRTLIDGTVGLGGHLQTILHEFPEIHRVLAVERDEEVMSQSQRMFKDVFEDWTSHSAKLEKNKKLVFPPSSAPAEKSIHWVNSRHSALDRICHYLKFPPADVILFDLGVCSLHLDIPQRGFSYKRCGPLDMRMSRSSPDTALSVLKETPEKLLIDLFVTNGDVENATAKTIAKAVRQSVQKKTLQTTEDLANLLESLNLKNKVPTVFQSLRMAVNEEFHELEQILKIAPRLLGPRGVLIFLSFQKNEDEAVRKAFETLQETGRFMAEDVVRPERNQFHANRRCRSVRMRVCRKLA